MMTELINKIVISNGQIEPSSEEIISSLLDEVRCLQFELIDDRRKSVDFINDFKHFMSRLNEVKAESMRVFI